MTDAPTFRLLYRSRDKIAEESRRTELGSLFGAARSNNKRQEITGALLVSEGWFVQVLEGEEQAVRALFRHIEKDPRHDSVALLDTREVDEPVFSRWSMAWVGADGEADIPLIAHVDGIAPSAGRQTTPEQDELLGVMRAAAHGDAHAV